MLLLLLLVLSLANGAVKPKSCYWDSECSSTAGECCSSYKCRSLDSCSILRNYPLSNFQNCYSSGDCQSGCCHNNFCTMKETCSSTSTALPIVLFLIIMSAVICALASVLIKDVVLYRKKKAAARANGLS